MTTGKKLKLTTYAEADIVELVKREVKRTRVSESDFIRGILIKHFKLDEPTPMGA